MKVQDILKKINPEKSWENNALMIGDQMLTRDDTVETYKQVEALFVPKNGVINHIEGIVLN